MPMLPAPHSGFTAELSAALLAAPTPLAASSALSDALGVPTSAARGGRFAIDAPLAGTLLVELLLGCVELCKEHAFSAPQPELALAVRARARASSTRLHPKQII